MIPMDYYYVIVTVEIVLVGLFGVFWLKLRNLPEKVSKEVGAEIKGQFSVISSNHNAQLTNMNSNHNSQMQMITFSGKELSKEHNELSKEHDKLSEEHNEILHEIKKSIIRQEDLNKYLGGQSVSEQEKTITSSLNNLKFFHDEYEKKLIENQELKKENLELKVKNQELSEKIREVEHLEKKYMHQESNNDLEL